MNKRTGTIFSRNFVSVFLVMTMFSCAFNMVTAYVADYAYSLGAAAALAGFLSGLANGVAVFLKPITVPMQVRIDKTRMLQAACLLGAVASIGYIFSPSVVWFMLFHFVAGAQVSIIPSLTLTLASESLPPEKLTSGLAIFGLGGNLGVTFGPMMGERLMLFVRSVADKTLGFKSVFLLAAALHLLGLAATRLLRYEENPAEKSAAFSEPWYKQIFEFRALIPALMSVLVFAANRLPSAFILLHCEEIGLSSSGAYFLVQGTVLIATRILMGKVLDRANLSVTYVAAAVLFASAFLVIGFAKTHVHLMIAAAMLAVGIGTLQPLMQTMCIRSAGEARRTIACNTSSIGTDFGCFIGPAILGGQMYALTGSYATVFKLASIPAAFSILLLFVFLLQQRGRGKAS